jgi:hypothetical protein
MNPDVASWIYDCSACEPYQTHTLSLLCARMHDPSKVGAMKLEQFMRYTARHLVDPYMTQRPGQDPTSDLNISGFTDSSSADRSDNQARATKGVIHFINTTPVMWQSTKIRRQSPNSNAAEEMAAASAASHDLVWMRQFMI